MRVRWASGVAGSCVVVAVVWLLIGMPAGAQRTDPIPGFAVKVEIQGIPGPMFIAELTGLGSESEVVEQKSVGPSGQPVVQSTPGRLKWKEIVIKRGLTADKSFWLWRAQVETGNLQGALRTFSITFLSSSLQPMARWEGAGGWPSKLIVPTPASSSSSTLMLEELTIAHSGLVRTL